MMKVIDFEAKRRGAKKEKRYEQVQSMVQFQQQDLFDELIAGEEKALTTEKEMSCGDFIKFLQGLGRDPLAVLKKQHSRNRWIFKQSTG